MFPAARGYVVGVTDQENILTQHDRRGEPRAAVETTGGLPELLAPAGNWDCARAAVENGADAVYFALERFNARLRADNFTAADLPKLMAYLHGRGVRGYACLNTIIFENELADAESDLRAMIAAGVDAVLVQDVGVARLVRRLSPDFPIHASTQMTITSAAGVEFARDLGCSLVVLARELSLKDIERIQREIRGLADRPPALEVFVHGALCVAYSGQCLTSEALGGRSANRGECAQACRLPYTLVCDGHPVPLGDRRYLLSPQDLAGLELLPELVRLGVASLKIEGRLKSPEYVAIITRLYRRALDRLTFGLRRRACAGSTTPAAQPDHASLSGRDRYEMEMAFSRGLGAGWLLGTNHQELVAGRFGKKRGVFLGQVRQVRRGGVVVQLTGPLQPGDGVVFDSGQPESAEQGGRIYEIRPVGRDGGRSGLVELRFGARDVDLKRVRAGDRLWKTSDPELERRVRQTFTGQTPQFRRPLMMTVKGRLGQPLELLVRDELGHEVRLASGTPLAAAQRQPLTPERLREHLGRLGDTPFRLAHLQNELPDGLLLPLSELNRLRREAVTALERLRSQPRRWTLHASSADPKPAAAPRTDAPSAPARLIVLVRSLAQLDAALKAGARTVYCDFEDLRHGRDAVALFRAAFNGGRATESPAEPPPSIWLAPPRICRPGETGMLRQVRAANPDGYLVRNYDHLHFFAEARRIGDYTLNIANSLAADHFKNRLGVERLTASYDLTLNQLEALVRAAPADWFEVTLHQHMPLFHMEHCVFCAFLSRGTGPANCGRPCERHTVWLRDRVGEEHRVLADAGCRNTVFQARVRTEAAGFERLRGLGLRHFRVEFLDETPGEVAATIGLYDALLGGRVSGPEVCRRLNVVSAGSCRDPGTTRARGN